jgi:hypothetical protein
VLSSQFGSLAPIGAEQTASGGYEIAWKDATGGFSIWSTDNKGNYVSTIIDHVVGTNTNLESQETFFQQDLNGDGVIGVPPTPPSGPDGGPVESPPASGPGGDSFVFQTDLGASSLTNSGHADTADLHTQSTALPQAILAMGQPTTLEMLIQHVNDSQDSFSAQEQLTSLPHVADLHAGSVFIH